MTRLVMVASAAALLFGFAPMAQGRGGFGRMPALDGRGKTLRLKIVGYKGGKMHVQVRNVGKRAATFKADGLYFVPAGKPESAPQRMGAAGPMEVSEAGTWKRKQAHRVGAKKTVTLRLDVFCLDSHRASPSDGQSFSVAHKRLPKRLRKKIVQGSNDLYRKAKRSKRPSRGAIQGYIWKTRNKRWIKLQGERKAEKSGRNRRSPRRYRRHRINRQQLRRKIRRRYKR
jgi:hypothetical protein